MTEETWGRLADRLEAAWPEQPMFRVRRDVYFEVLADLDDARVEAAVAEVLAEDRDRLPPPGAIRARAGAAVPPPPATVTQAYGPVDTAPDDPALEELTRLRRRPWLGVLFGLIGIFPVAIWLGVRVLVDRERERNSGRRYPGETWAAITAIVLGLWGVVWLVAFLV